MKTALQHFNELPQPYGQMAIEETIKQGKKFKLKFTTREASYALVSTFTWDESVVGHDFWAAIYDNLQHLESKTTDK